MDDEVYDYALEIIENKYLALEAQRRLAEPNIKWVSSDEVFGKDLVKEILL